MPKKKEHNQKEEVADERFIMALRNTVRAQLKGDTHAVVDTLTNVTDYLMPKRWVTTGDDLLDLIISNRPDGGLPFGKFVNIYGDSTTGKSLIACKIMANVQKMGGVAVYFDTEHASFPPYLEVLGIDPEEVLYILHVRSVEKIFQTIITIILEHKRLNNKHPLCFVIDSMTATNLEAVMNDLEDFSDQGYQTGAKKQKVVGDAIRKIIDYVKDENILLVTTDQMRDNMNKKNMYDDQKLSTSGNAQIFYSDIRIQLKKRRTIKSGTDIIGSEVEAYTVKNRTAPPYRKSIFHVYHTKGIDRFASWIENGKVLGILQTRGAYIQVDDANGEKILIDGKMPSAKDIKRLLRTNEDFRKAVYNRFVEKLQIFYEIPTATDFEELDDVIELVDDGADVPDGE
jgi:recombination protein RecA